MEFVIQWITQYSYTGLFVLLVLGIVGIPLPDEILLAWVGCRVSQGQMHGPLALLVSFAGSACGITLSYILGCTLGHWLIVRYGHWVCITPQRLARVHAWFEMYGKWTLVFGYFLPGIRHVTAYTAGMTEMRYKTFAPYAYAGALLWSGTFLIVGYVLGPGWQVLHAWLPAGSGAVMGLVLVACVLYYVVRRFRRPMGPAKLSPPRKEGTASGAYPPPAATHKASRQYAQSERDCA